MEQRLVQNTNQTNSLFVEFRRVNPVMEHLIDPETGEKGYQFAKRILADLAVGKFVVVTCIGESGAGGKGHIQRGLLTFLSENAYTAQALAFGEELTQLEQQTGDPGLREAPPVHLFPLAIQRAISKTETAFDEFNKSKIPQAMITEVHALLEGAENGEAYVHRMVELQQAYPDLFGFYLIGSTTNHKTWQEAFQRRAAIARATSPESLSAILRRSRMNIDSRTPIEDVVTFQKSMASPQIMEATWGMMNQALVNHYTELRAFGHSLHHTIDDLPESISVDYLLENPDQRDRLEAVFVRWKIDSWGVPKDHVLIAPNTLINKPLPFQETALRRHYRQI